MMRALGLLWLVTGCGPVGHSPPPDAAPQPAVDAATPDAAVEPTPDAAIRPTPDAAPQPTPDAAAEPTPDAAVEPTPDAAAEPTPDAAVEPTPDAAMPPTPDAAVEPTPDAAMPPTPDAAAQPTPDAALPLPDAALPPPPAEPLPDCVPRTPVSQFGYFAAPGAHALEYADLVPLGGAADPLPAFEYAPDEAPLGLTAAPGGPGNALFFLALRSDAACRLVGLEPVTGARWSVGADVLDCAPPATSAAGVLWPVITAAGPALRVIDPVDGETLHELPLPVSPSEAPAGAPVALGDERIQNGGSHWLVAGDGAVVLVGGVSREAEPVVLAVEPVPGEVTALAATHTGSAPVVVALFKSDPAVEGLGDRAARFDVAAGPTLVPRPDVALGALARTPPLLAHGCDDLVANGGSHWWCPGGAFAVGVDGAVAVWAFDTGMARAPVLLGDDFRPTGLTLGGDDRIFNGGSHWRGAGQGQYALRATDPGTGASTTLDGGPALHGTCVAAPVLDTDGRLATSRQSPDGPLAVTLLQTDARGLGHGFARPGGDNGGRGVEVRSDAVCIGGDAYTFGAPITALPTLTALDATTLPDGSRVIVGEKIGEAVPVNYFYRLSAAGDVLWVQTLQIEADATTALTRITNNGAEILAVGTRFDRLVGAPRPRLVRLSLAGNVVEDRVVPDLGDANGRFAALRDAGGAWLVASAAALGDTHLLEIDANGAVLNDAVIGNGGAFEARDFVRHPSGFLFVGSEAAGPTRDARVLLTDTAGAVLDEERVVPPAGSQLAHERLALAADGRVLLAGGRQDLVGGQITWYFRSLDPALNLVGESDLPGIDRIAGLTFGARDDAWLLSQDFQLVRLTTQGAVGPGKVLVAGPGSFATALTRTVDGAPVAHGHVLLADGLTRAPWQGLADPDGRFGCGAAGRCTTGRAIACGDDDPCTLEACVPGTGACAAAPLPDGAPCGSGLTCVGGACR
jgi:hypothetical protein